MTGDNGYQNSKPIVSLSGLTIGFDSKNPLVKVPDLKIYPGEIVAITGASNSTLPKLPPRGSIGYIPQRLGLVRHASVKHNVMMGARAGHTTPYAISPSAVSISRTKDAIERMGLTDKIDEPIRRLSGGQQRRVATARSLAQSPRLIMADEFLSELDEETLNSVLFEVTEHVRSNQAALIVVEHDVSRAKSMADRLLVIDDGRVNPFLSETTALEVNL